MLVKELFDMAIFEQTKCLNATALYLAKQQNLDIKKLGLGKEVLDNANAILVKTGLIQDDDLVLEFNEFWQAYGKHGNKKNALSAFKKLSKADRQLVRQNVMDYVKATPDKQYRKHAQGYLNGRMFDPSNYQVTGAKQVISDNFEVRLNAMLNTLKQMGYVRDYKNRHLTNENQVRQFLEREKHFKVALSNVAQNDFGVSIHDSKIQKGGEYYSAFMQKRQQLIDEYF